jgi:hypothetical protein
MSQMRLDGRYESNCSSTINVSQASSHFISLY